MRSPPLTYSITKNKRSCTKNNNNNNTSMKTIRSYAKFPAQIRFLKKTFVILTNPKIHLNNEYAKLQFNFEGEKNIDFLRKETECSTFRNAVLVEKALYASKNCPCRVADGLLTIYTYKYIHLYLYIYIHIIIYIYIYIIYM